MKNCPKCGEVFTAIVDRWLDCVVAYRCEACKFEMPESMAKIITLADPAAIKDIPGH